MSVAELVEPMPAAIARWLAAQVIDGERPFRDCRVTGPLVLRPLSRLFRCTAPGFAAPLALKFCLTPDRRPDIALARRQFEALSWLRDRAEIDPNAVEAVHVRHLLEEQGCLVMDWVEGRSVAALLASPLTIQAEVEYWSGRAGAWLRSFHAMRKLTPRPTKTDAMLGQLSDGLAHAPALARNPCFVHGDDVLRRLAARVASIPVPTSVHHGDFKAENLTIADATLIGLDIASTWDDSVTLDIAKFLRDTAFRSWRPAGWMLGRRFDTIATGFLAGYTNGARLDFDLALAWARLQGVLRFWIELEAAPPDPIRETYERYRFEQIVSEGAGELLRAAR